MGVIKMDARVRVRLENFIRRSHQLADEAMNGLHCGSENHEYRAAERLWEYHMTLAKAVNEFLNKENQPITNDLYGETNDAQ